MGIKKVKTTQSKVSSVRLDEQVWPVERDIFFRPARMKYVRKLIKPQGCVFCTSAEKPMTQKTLCVYKSKYSQVVVNKYPYNSGHVLVLPLRHIGDIMQLSIEEYSDLHLTLKLAIKVIQSVYQPHGLNLGMNHGVTGGAGIPDHLHYHIVPRWNGDLNFFPLIAETKLVIETAESTFKKLNKEFIRSSKKSRTNNKLTKKEKL
jgi:ATP adenylyltransferase